MPVSFALDAPPSSSACATTSLPAKSDASAPPAADGLLLSRGPSHDHFFAPWRAPLSRLNLKGRRDMPSDNLLAHNANTTKRPRPKLILPIGSGRTGKSLWSRWFIDRAAGHRSQLDIIDGDTINPCLASFYKSARVPPAFKGDQPTWFEKPSNPASKAGAPPSLSSGPGCSTAGSPNCLSQSPLQNKASISSPSIS
jgi:hypothetical protein